MLLRLTSGGNGLLVTDGVARLLPDSVADAVTELDPVTVGVLVRLEVPVGAAVRPGVDALVGVTVAVPEAVSLELDVTVAD